MVQDTGANLNAYAEAGASGCCSSGPCCSPDDTASPVSPVHDGLAEVLQQFDANQYAASVRVHALKSNNHSGQEAAIRFRSMTSRCVAQRASAGRRSILCCHGSQPISIGSKGKVFRSSGTTCPSNPRHSSRTRPCINCWRRREPVACHSSWSMAALSAVAAIRRGKRCRCGLTPRCPSSPRTVAVVQHKPPGAPVACGRASESHHRYQLRMCRDRLLLKEESGHEISGTPHAEPLLHRKRGRRQNIRCVCDSRASSRCRPARLARLDRSGLQLGRRRGPRRDARASPYADCPPSLVSRR